MSVTFFSVPVGFGPNKEEVSNHLWCLGFDGGINLLAVAYNKPPRFVGFTVSYHKHVVTPYTGHLELNIRILILLSKSIVVKVLFRQKDPE